MKTMSKNNIINFLKNQELAGNSVWAFINGGGVSCVSPDEIDNFINVFSAEEYDSRVECIEKGNEPEDFILTMSSDEYEGTDCFYRVEHRNEYNQENMDIYIQHKLDYPKDAINNDRPYLLGRATAIIKCLTAMPIGVVNSIAQHPIVMVRPWLIKSTIKGQDALMEVMSRIDTIPTILTSSEQGRFWMGYYHQMEQAKSTNKDNL